MTFDLDALQTDHFDDPKMDRQLARVHDFLSRHCKRRDEFAMALWAALESFARSLELERLDVSHGGDCRRIVWFPVAQSSPAIAHTFPEIDVEAMRWPGFESESEFVRLVQQFHGDGIKTLTVAACMLINWDYSRGDVEAVRKGLDLFDELSDQRRSKAGAHAHRQATINLERHRKRAIELWDASKLPKRERIASIIERLGGHPTTGQAFNRSTVDRWLRKAGRRSSAS